MRRTGGPRAARLAFAVAVALLAALVLAQLVLPRIAASRISSRIGRYGRVEHVAVSAWPAVKLLWGSADTVHVRTGALHLSPKQAASLLWEGRGVAEMDIAAAAVRVGPLALTGAILRKRGAQLEAQADTTQAAADAALGAGEQVRLLSSVGGRVRVAVAGSLFGVGATVPAVAEAKDGRLVAHAEGFLLEGIELTLFADPHVHVEGVQAGAERGGYRLAMSALLG
jgi:hypothetical protein